MLKIFKLKLKEYNDNYRPVNFTYSSQNRQGLPISNGWSDNIYLYNKSNIKSLPSTHNYIFKLITIYFTMFSKTLERNLLDRKCRIRRKRFSTNRVLLSKPNIKYTNDIINITFYVYNRRLTFYLNKLKNLYTLVTLRPKIFKNKIIYIRDQISKINRNILNAHNILTSALKWDNSNLINFSRNISRKFIKRVFLKERLYLYLRQIVLFNNYKFSDKYLLPLKNALEKIYRKKVEFNIISLKYYHLNSDIFLQAIAIKVKSRRNRVLRVINKSLKKIKIPSKYSMLYRNNSYIVNNFLQSKKVEINNSIKITKNSLNKILGKYLLNMNFNSVGDTKHYDTVISSLKYKSFNGVRIEASGRLTKRITAQRSVRKLKYMGGIKDLYSSYVGLPSIMLKGNTNCSVQHTKIKSKTRIGSFGLKGWVNSI